MKRGVRERKTASSERGIGKKTEGKTEEKTVRMMERKTEG